MKLDGIARLVGHPDHRFGRVQAVFRQTRGKIEHTVHPRPAQQESSPAPLLVEHRDIRFAQHHPSDAAWRAGVLRLLTGVGHRDVGDGALVHMVQPRKSLPRFASVDDVSANEPKAAEKQQHNHEKYRKSKVHRFDRLATEITEIAEIFSIVSAPSAFPSVFYVVNDYRRTHQTKPASSAMIPGRNSQDAKRTKSYSLRSRFNSRKAKAGGRMDTSE